MLFQRCLALVTGVLVIHFVHSSTIRQDEQTQRQSASNDLLKSVIDKRSFDTLISTSAMSSDSCADNPIFRMYLQQMVDAEIRRLELCMSQQMSSNN